MKLDHGDKTETRHRGSFADELAEALGSTEFRLSIWMQIWALMKIPPALVVLLLPAARVLKYLVVSWVAFEALLAFGSLTVLSPKVRTKYRKLPSSSAGLALVWTGTMVSALTYWLFVLQERTLLHGSDPFTFAAGSEQLLRARAAENRFRSPERWLVAIALIAALQRGGNLVLIGILTPGAPLWLRLATIGWALIEIAAAGCTAWALTTSRDTRLKQFPISRRGRAAIFIASLLTAFGYWLYVAYRLLRGRGSPHGKLA